MHEAVKVLLVMDEPRFGGLDAKGHNDSWRGGVFHPSPYFYSAHGYFSFDFSRDNIFMELAFFIIRIVSVRREDMIEGLSSILALKRSYEALY